MVQPRLSGRVVGEFFRQHLARDVQVLQKVLGRSADDVYLLLHHLCHSLATAQQSGNRGVEEWKF
jgi:hypothetical protein